MGGLKLPRLLKTDVYDSVLGPLMCYPGWMAQPAALFVGVIEFLFYQIPTQNIRVGEITVSFWNSDGMGWVASAVGICQAWVLLVGVGCWVWGRWTTGDSTL